MKIRNGFVSNSSSSSFVIALPKSYVFSEDEMISIREQLEDYDSYFSYYEELAEQNGETEILDEREKIQKMLDTGQMPEDDAEPVNDEVKNKDIQKGFEFLTTTGHLWTDDWIEGPEGFAAKAIVDVLLEKIQVADFDVPSDCGSVINILSDSYIESNGMKLLKDFFTNEDKKWIRIE